MRIGLFTDTYYPAVNGIVYVVEITKRQLEAMGHEVFVFCPSDNMRLSKKGSDKHVIRFRSAFKGLLFDDYNISVFLPAKELHRIKKYNLDVIQFFTPGQIGLIGVYSAQKNGTVLVAQHSTDLAQYITHYPAVVPGLLLLILALPVTYKLSGRDLHEMVKLYKPRRLLSDWGQDIVESMMSMIYSRCDSVIALSQKSKKQLESWRNPYWYEVSVLPTGVDVLKKPTLKQVAAFKSKYDIAEDDKVVLYAGRLSSEKNLDILIPAIKRVLRKEPKARLLYVGDFEYRATLEQAARNSGVGSRITFTGSLPRQYLGTVYAAADVFAFPSLTDTQGLVLNEAANAGLPFVIIDRQVSEVVINGENGFIAANNVKSLSDNILKLLSNKKLREKFGKRSQELAAMFSEKSQTKKLVDIFEKSLEKNKES